jgi:hypothetical protein
MEQENKQEHGISDKVSITEPAPKSSSSISTNEWKTVKHDLPVFDERSGSMELPAKSIETDFAIPDAVDLASIMPATPEQAINRDMLMDVIKVEGKADDVEKFKAICATHAPAGSPMAVQTTCGLPLGVVQSMLREAQAVNPKIDLLKDKIVVTPKIKRNCKKCNGSGTLGRLANTGWTKTNGQAKFHDYKMKCSCLKLEMKLETPPAPEAQVQPEADNAPESGGQTATA